MDCIILIGGVKQEFGEKEANNVVEIGFDDIIDEEQESKALEDENIWHKKYASQIKGVVSKEDRNEYTAETANTDLSNDENEMDNEERNDNIEHIKGQNRIFTSSSEDDSSSGSNSICNENEEKGLNMNKEEAKEVLLINFKPVKAQPMDVSSKVQPHEIIFKAPDQFICVYCKVVRNNKKAASSHIRLYHRENRKKQCPHCPYTNKFGKLRGHIISKHTDLDKVEGFSCHQCGLKLKVKSHLRRHIHTVHYVELKKCTVCDKGFKRICGLRRHMLHIHGDKPVKKKYGCHICDYSSTVRELLDNHIEIHHKDINELKTLKCDECNFTTKFAFKLKTHKQKIHKREKAQCHLCSYQASASSLKLHLISHQKEKKEEDLKLKCTECSYKTYRHYSLEVHKIKHKKPSEIQYFECFHCGFKANRKDNLKVHIARHGKNNDILFQCFICDFKTKSKFKYVGHIDKHAKKLEKTVKITVSSADKIKLSRVNK